MRSSYQLLLLLLLLLPLAASSSESAAVAESGTNSTDESIKIVDWKWHEVQTNAVVVLFLLVTCVLKTLYHHIHVLVKYVPESNVLILLGVAIGVIVFFTVPEEERTSSFWDLEPHLFFFILLPPIMLEAAYSLYDRAFVDNIGSILFFAVGGTVLNFLVIGFALFGLSAAGAMSSSGGRSSNLPLNICLLFGSFIVAVDPVAVLAIFQDIGVDHSLYYLVFGESLLNDAVTVVLYNTMNSFLLLQSVQSTDIILGVVSFFTISLGGLVIGVIFGILSSIITRFTRSTRVVEPLVILTLAYGSYVCGDLFGWSGLIAIIGCGLVQAAYAFHNISAKSLITLKYFTKMTASAGEAIVFLYLGVELVKKSHVWDTGFTLWALVLCVAARFLVTFTSSAALNRAGRHYPIKLTEQFIIAFGGLRGAVAFALARLVSADALSKAGAPTHVKEMFLTTTLFIVMVTCLGNGMLIKPIVKCLNIRLEQRQLTCVLHEVINHTMDHLSAGIEEIIGRRGDNYFREAFDRLDARYIRPLLQRDPATQDEKIVEIYHKVDLKMHLASTLNNQKQSSHLLSSLAPSLTRHISSSSSFQKELSPVSSASGDLGSLAPQPQRRIGQRRLSVSENPQTVAAEDVRKIMQHAKKQTQQTQQAHSKFSKALHSDEDIENNLNKRRSRTARAVRMLRHTGSLLHHRGHHHACASTANAAAMHSADFCEQKTEGENGQREQRAKKIHFAVTIDEEDRVEEDGNSSGSSWSAGIDNSSFDVNVVDEDTRL